MIFLPAASIANNNDSRYLKNITGTVSDESNNPIPGATVSIKGKTVGTQTDVMGRFSIDANENDVLVITAVGYNPKEIVIGTAAYYSVVMETMISEMEQVVVVGYGTQKKENLTGSIATVSGDELLKRPVQNPINLLQGKVSGLKITQAYAKPGDPGNAITIRGTGTFSSAGSSPLVLIDGIAGDMSNLDPNNIESVTVLKDAASSAIYGARAANGVIIVTTKKGKAGKLVIGYDGYVQAQQATKLPDLLYNSADYMEYWNEGRIRNGLLPYFSQEDIDAFRNHPNDPIHYPNYNWIKNTFKTAFVQKHHLNMSGGNEKTTFNLGLGYYDQDGIISIYGAKNYDMLMAVDSKIKEWITVGGNIRLNKTDYTENYINSANGDYLLGVYGSGPNYTPTMKLADGTEVWVGRYSSDIGEWTVRNPVEADKVGYDKHFLNNIATQFYVDIKLAKNLHWLSKVAATYNNELRKLRESPADNYYFKDTTIAHNNAPVNEGLTENYSDNFLTTVYSTLNYENTFNNDHFLNVLVGYNQESNLYRQLGGRRIHFPTPDLSELNAASAADQSTSGTANEWAIQSLFGRINYSYKAKYLVEGDIRYDGTSRIAPGQRWGTFPSVSVGWRLSKESFMDQLNWISDLKLRASYGELGNQNVGLYPYQDILSTTSYPFSSLDAGVQLTRLVDKALKWETTRVADIGLDLDIDNGIFSATVDWYNKVTDGILYQIPIPASVGLSAPTVNYGKMKNTGWEFAVGHRNQVGAVAYGVNFNLSTNKNEVLKILAPSLGNTIVQEGLPFNSFYMIKWIGIFQSQDEIDKSPVHPYNPKPGDLKFEDANDDGKIDANDRVVVPGAYPKFIYGGSIDLSWKNFSLTAFFQGVEGQMLDVNGGGWGISPYVQGAPPPMDLVKNHWTEQNHTNQYPAMYVSGYAPVTGTRSTYWLLDASYFRVKNISIGYSFPPKICKRIGLNDLRIYVSGDNILTFTNYPGADPERVQSVGRYSAYPQVKSYTLGLNLNF